MYFNFVEKKAIFFLNYSCFIKNRVINSVYMIDPSLDFLILAVANCPLLTTHAC